MMDRETQARTIPSGHLAPRAPGVHYETLAARTPQPVFRTGIPVFVGFARLMPDGQSTSIRHICRWQQFEQWHEPLPESYLHYAVRGFFENGGEQCVVALVQSDHNSGEMTAALTQVFEQGSVLEDIEDIDLVCVPDAMLEIIRKTSHAAVLGIQSAALEHCSRMGDRFAILDGFLHDDDKRVNTEQPGNGVDLAVSHWQALPPEHGALYYPWVSVKKHHPAGESDTSYAVKTPCDIYAMNRAHSYPGPIKSYEAEPVPPCGHIAGVYSRTDSRVGVHKAPANEALDEVLKLEIYFSDDEQAMLNDAGVNCLRSFAGRGIRVWGARTLSGQPLWSYVNVRRLFLTLARWLKRNMNDLVYETNNQRLWERIRERLLDYCRNLFDQGALLGNSPAQAFFVKCDAETNTAERQEAGEVVAEVGLAPAVPAEFVVVRITQNAGTIVVTGLNVP